MSSVGWIGVSSTSTSRCGAGAPRSVGTWHVRALKQDSQAENVYRCRQDAGGPGHGARHLVFDQLRTAQVYAQMRGDVRMKECICRKDGTRQKRLRKNLQTKTPPELAIAVVLLLLPGCLLRIGSVSPNASVSPSRKAGSLLVFPVSADLTFPLCPSARSSPLLNRSPLM
jgi:hypothetical protein